MAALILALVISCAAIAAGWSYVRMARRMRSFVMTRGTVVDRRVATVAGMSSREGRWGRGGGYRPVVTFSYVVDGVTHTSDRWSYATEGLKRSAAEKLLSDVPDEVDVHFDPKRPGDAYLHGHRPRLGYVLVAAGIIGVIISLAALFG